MSFRSTIDAERLEAAYQKAKATLLAERNAAGHWEGELSTSALSTATAIMALCLVQKQLAPHHQFDDYIHAGLGWLEAHQNDDGGWGDTVLSISNISTTMLCRSAIHLTGSAGSHAKMLGRAEAWLFERYGRTPAELAEAVRKRYGKDRTFATPILTTCALAGLVSWREVPPLPFELACFPQSWFRFLRLHVVSYALPALIAIGQAIYYHRKPWNPLTLFTRWLSRGKSLDVLTTIQPSSGGFLEATPLTSFVTLSLASIGQSDHPVARLAVEFLTRSMRPDGGWAIDTNLATWVTTLSINALAAGDDLGSIDRRDALVAWLLGQQYRERHPYTGADPGAWAWTDLPGGVPDADDTPGAILALASLGDATSIEAGNRACEWLVNLQNRDGGWPTFCRGWGALPFDRSGCDLTAHALRALARQQTLSPRIERQKPIERGLAYLQRTQRADGSWLPLWFGNQHGHDDENPTYGTAKVLKAYRDLGRLDDEPARRGFEWLLKTQNADGGWGAGVSSLEETGLVVEVLAESGPSEALNRGVTWLMQRVEAGGLREPTPIGFYFAKLWYFEKLYPIIFTVGALGRVHSASIMRSQVT